MVKILKTNLTVSPIWSYKKNILGIQVWQRFMTEAERSTHSKIHLKMAAYFLTLPSILQVNDTILLQKDSFFIKVKCKYLIFTIISNYDFHNSFETRNTPLICQSKLKAKLKAMFSKT
jgi:hypothetical protein